MQEGKSYRVAVKTSDKYTNDPDDKIIIRMKTLIKDKRVDELSFGSNHEIVNQELHAALDPFQLWIKQKLSHPEIITKLQDLDRLQYGHDLACEGIGQAIAELYHQFLLDNQK